MTLETREKAQELIKEIMVLREDISDLEKRFQKIQSETIKIYEKLNGILDEENDAHT